MAPNGKLTKTDLSKHLAKKLDCTKKDAGLLVNAFFRSMTTALKSGDGVELRGFGSFRVRARASRMGRNPKNGQPVQVPPKLVVRFKTGRDLRSRLTAPAAGEAPDPRKGADGGDGIHGDSPLG